MIVNKSNRIMIQCTTVVARDAVRRENINGVEHIIISSFTLPDNIVMNGGLYPADEIDKSFETLELSLSPIEHPTDSSGNFISAKDPDAINNFYVGAYNKNVRKEGKRVRIDKYVNVQEALKTDKGHRLLDRIKEIETNEKARPIHTSVGVFLLVEDLDEPQTNADGQEFTWIARDMVFDHDAILLDSVGAAQPHQGVGMAVNGQDDPCEVQTYVLNSDDHDDVVRARDSTTCSDHGLSFGELHNAISEALERSAINFDWIEEVFQDEVIFVSRGDLFTVPYLLDTENDRVTIVGIPLRVERNVTFTPKTNRKGDYVKDEIIKALKDAAIETDGLDETQLFAKYNEMLQANKSNGSGDSDESAELAEVVANAIKPLTEKIDGLEAKINQSGETELASLAELIGNSDKYPGIDADAAKLLGIETLKGMVANCQESYGIPNFHVVNNQQSVATDMPD